MQALVGPVVDRSLGPLLDRLGRDVPLDPGGPGPVVAADPVDQVGIPEPVEVGALVEEPDLGVVAAVVVVVADVQRLVDVGDEMDEEQDARCRSFLGLDRSDRTLRYCLILTTTLLSSRIRRGSNLASPIGTLMKCHLALPGTASCPSLSAQSATSGKVSGGMSSSPIAAFAAGLRRPSATRAITRCPCGPQAKAVEVQATASIEQAPSRTARVAIIGATSLDGRIDEEGGPAARGGTGRSPRFECLDDHVTTDKPTISRPAGGRKLAPGGRLLATSEESPNSSVNVRPHPGPPYPRSVKVGSLSSCTRRSGPTTPRRAGRLAEASLGSTEASARACGAAMPAASSRIASKNGSSGSSVREFDTDASRCVLTRRRFHPTRAYFVSWIARIFSLKNSRSRNPYACRFIVLILLFVPSIGPLLIITS